MISSKDTRLKKVEEELNVKYTEPLYVVITKVKHGDHGVVEIGVLNDEVIVVPNDGTDNYKISHDEYLELIGVPHLAMKL